MAKKPRCTSCSTGWCKNHLFELNPTSNSLYYRKNFRLRLCPRFNKQTSHFQKIIPLFNEDKKYYTPSFYLDEEKKYYHQNDQRTLRNHKLKIDEDLNSNQTIWVPRHARKRNYCFVCKSDYNDYLQHTYDNDHKKCLRNNPFTKYINQIEEKYFKGNDTQIEQKLNEDDLKRQPTTEESSSISEQSSKSFEFIRKLIKPNEVLPIIIDNLDNQSEIIQQNN